MKFGSVCSGIEAASLAFEPLNICASWFSEIAEFPKKVLAHHYPDTPNIGDMNEIAELIENKSVEAPDILCGGTPCQAFSLAGWKQGLIDSRGQLTLKFIEVADAIDKVRKDNSQKEAIILWENVEGVLRDKTNAFGAFIAGLTGLEEEIKVKRWSTSGVLFGKKRNLAWRVLDAKYFGLPQQRRRLFLIATATHINPEKILFETIESNQSITYLNLDKIYKKNSSPTLFDFDIESSKENLNIKYFKEEKIEVFRKYTDCLYSAYGTKWNGNAAAYNGSLYFSQNDKIRRLTPIECERLMGIPDNYTLIEGSKDTTRYQAIGNSWAIPVVKWITTQISNHINLNKSSSWIKDISPTKENEEYNLYLFQDKIVTTKNNQKINVSEATNSIKMGNIFDIVHLEVPEKFYISPKASQGILRRKESRKINMNPSLEKLFSQNSFSS